MAKKIEPAVVYARYAQGPLVEKEYVPLVLIEGGVEIPRPVSEIVAELNEILRRTLPPELGFEGFSQWPEISVAAEKGALWPLPWRWIAAYAVTGDNEAHYVHIDLVRVPVDEPLCRRGEEGDYSASRRRRAGEVGDYTICRRKPGHWSRHMAMTKCFLGWEAACAIAAAAGKLLEA